MPTSTRPQLVRAASKPARRHSNERLALYQQLFANGSSEIDLFQIDVIWPGILADHLIDLRPYANGAEQEHLQFLMGHRRQAFGRPSSFERVAGTRAGLLRFRARAGEAFSR